ncbi:MAG: hypothetical protein BZY75_01470 [SAR202 cluster bacterium Io17-Chloro-G7]|nr:MAG: hypothetical protein BZY75_01470 [SAR202 cluster bacterium Io17-Chloro-G7]
MSSRRSKRRVSAAFRSGARRNQRKGLLYGGVAAALVIVVALAVTLVSLGSGLVRAADFSISLYQGVEEVGGAKEINFSRFHGGPVILNFWAALCPPCRAEMPGFQQFHNQFKDDITLIGVDVGPFTGFGDGGHLEAAKLLRDLGITYPAGFTTDSSVTRKYSITSMPTTLFINSEGEIFEKRSGLLRPNNLINIIDAMMSDENRPQEDNG